MHRLRSYWRPLGLATAIAAVNLAIMLQLGVAYKPFNWQTFADITHRPTGTRCSCPSCTISNRYPKELGVRGDAEPIHFSTQIGGAHPRGASHPDGSVVWPFESP